MRSHARVWVLTVFCGVLMGAALLPAVGQAFGIKEFVAVNCTAHPGRPRPGRPGLARSGGRPARVAADQEAGPDLCHRRRHVAHYHPGRAGPGRRGARGRDRFRSLTLPLLAASRRVIAAGDHPALAVEEPGPRPWPHRVRAWSFCRRWLTADAAQIRELPGPIR